MFDSRFDPANQGQAFAERRFKVVRVGARDLLRFVFQLSGPPGEVCLCHAPLPPDYRVVTIDRNWPNNWVDVLLSSMAFDPVPEGQTAPVLGDGEPFMWHAYALATQEEVAARALKAEAEVRAMGEVPDNYVHPRVPPGPPVSGPFPGEEVDRRLADVPTFLPTKESDIEAH